MLDTPNLDLPLLAAQQAQKHVTHNEALLVLDALVQCAVETRGENAPPPAAADGLRFIVGSSPGGEWAGHPGELAVRLDGGWTFHEARTGLLAFVRSEGAFVVRGDDGWAPLGCRLAEVQRIERLGLGTDADGASPFSARLNGALWAATPAGEGGTGDLRCAFSKSGPANVASLLFQDGYSGRAELGLVGDDDFRLKVSADGTTFRTALVVDRDTGFLSSTLVLSPAKLPPIPPQVGTRLHLAAENTEGCRMFFDHYGNAANASLGFRKVRGSIAAPAPLRNGDIIMALASFGFGTSGVSPGPRANIQSWASGDWSDASQGTRLVFYTTPPGTTSTAARLAVEGDGTLNPGQDDAQPLGSPAARWSTVHAATGTISTSDARLKTPVAPLAEAELAAAAGIAAGLGTFRFNASLAAKGEERARLHVGTTVQDAMAVLRGHGLDPTRYAFVCHDRWAPDRDAVPDGPASEPPAPGVPTPAGPDGRPEAGDPSDRYGFRADQLAFFLIRGLAARVSALEARLSG